MITAIATATAAPPLRDLVLALDEAAAGLIEAEARSAAAAAVTREAEAALKAASGRHFEAAQKTRALQPTRDAVDRAREVYAEAGDVGKVAHADATAARAAHAEAGAAVARAMHARGWRYLRAGERLIVQATVWPEPPTPTSNRYMYGSLVPLTEPAVGDPRWQVEVVDLPAIEDL
jgi:hypothetical protein